MDSYSPNARDFEDGPHVKEVCVESRLCARDGSGLWRDNDGPSPRPHEASIVFRLLLYSQRTAGGPRS